jgi:hypothetical protein
MTESEAPSVLRLVVIGVVMAFVGELIDIKQLRKVGFLSEILG